MAFLILISILVSAIATGLAEHIDTNISRPLSNTSGFTKDMYVIHAMVYQVGIITNETSNETDTDLGKQEAVTFFHSNGSKIDFNKIAQPILTNLTAQSLMGVMTRSTAELKKSLHQEEPHGMELEVDNLNDSNINKSAVGGNDIVKIVKGYAVIPEEAGVQSLAIPPLLALNKNLTNIPIPIPNTSIVRYGKINTLLQIPGVQYF